MKALMLSSLVVLVGVSTALGQDLVREVSWAALKKEKKLLAGEVQEGQARGPTDVLKVENTSDQSKTVTVLDLEKPGITSIHYAVAGRVRYEGVEKAGYLELWSWFANGGMYFTRTLGDSGPLEQLKGSSDWRPFSLPFFSNEKTGAPTRIVVNVVLPGRGQVFLGPLRIEQYKGDPLSASGDVASARVASLIGGVLGLLLAVLAGSAGILAALGKGRRVALGLVGVLIAVGLASVVFGLASLAMLQPPPVSLALLLGGVVALAVAVLGLPLLRRRYGLLELRRMAAMDVGGTL